MLFRTRRTMYILSACCILGAAYALFVSMRTPRTLLLPRWIHEQKMIVPWLERTCSSCSTITHLWHTIQARLPHLRITKARWLAPYTWDIAIEEHPYIAHVTWHDRQYTLTTDGVLVDACISGHPDNPELPHITAQSSQPPSAYARDLTQFVKGLKEPYSHASIAWHDVCDIRITIQDAQATWHILVTATTPFSDSLCTALDTIMREHMSRSTTRKKRPASTFTLDARYARQVVVT